MMTITDEYPLRERFDCVIPLTITKHRGEEPKIEVYESFSQTAVTFLTHFDAALFSTDAARWLTERMKGEMARYGYEPDPIYSLTYTVEYSLTPGDIAKLNTSLITPQTQRIDASELDSDRNISGMLSDCDTMNALCFATVTPDGLLASVSCENFAGMTDRGPGETEVAVSTSVDFAGRGYAASNAAALVKVLLERGDTAYYVCDADNYPSCRVAEKIGLEVSACTYSLVCYKK